MLPITGENKGDKAYVPSHRFAFLSLLFLFSFEQGVIIEDFNELFCRKRSVTDLLITTQQFESFKKHHESLACMVPEDNSLMQNSYLLLDESILNYTLLRSIYFLFFSFFLFI